MLEHHDKLNGSATAFIRAFSDLIKESTSHLATKDDLADMRADLATREDIGATNKNMQAQFARQEEKFAEVNQNMRNMRAQFAEQEKNITEINRKLD